MNIFDAKNGFEWRDYLKIIQRRKWYFLVPFLLVLGFGVFKVLTLKHSYESYTIIQIQESVLPKQLSRLVPGFSDAPRFANWKKLILSSEYLGQLITNLKLDQDPLIVSAGMGIQGEHPDKSLDDIVRILLITKLRNNVFVKQYSENHVEIRGSARTSEQAHDIVAGLGEIFQRDFLQREVSNIKNALQFNDEQIETFQKKLQASESRYNAYQRQMLGKRNADDLLDTESRRRVSDALLTAELNARQKQNALAMINSRLDSRLAVQPPPVTPAIQNYSQELRKRVSEDARLLTRFAPGSAELLNVSRVINQLRENLRREFEKSYSQQSGSGALLVSRALADIDVQISENRVRSLRKILDSSKDFNSLAQTKDLQLDKYAEEVKMNRDVYNLLLQQAQGTQIEEAMQRANAASRISVIEPATLPLEPETVSRRTMAMLMMAVALTIGLIAVYLREYFDGSLQTVEEAENYFNLPVLCVLPYLEKDQIKDRNKTDDLIRKKHPRQIMNGFEKNSIRN